jgi:hypothetical protein
MPIFASDDLPLFFEDFGEPALLKRRAAATSTAVSAVFDEGKALGKGGDVGEDADEVMRPGMGNYSIIYLSQVAVPTKPAYQDIVKRGASGTLGDFTILQTKAEDGLWKCWAVDDERMGF